MSDYTVTVELVPVAFSKEIAGRFHATGMCNLPREFGPTFGGFEGINRVHVIKSDDETKILVAADWLRDRGWEVTIKRGK